MPLDARFIEELLAVEHGAELTRIRELLVSLSECDWISAPSLHERVQGGSFTPVAERRVELLEALEWHYAPFISLVKVCEAQTDRKRVSYYLGILDGLHGDALLRRGIGRTGLRECRRWFLRVWESIERVHGIARLAEESV